MKKLLIVPILALAATLLAPAAHANHGGAQSPDTQQGNTEACEVFYVFHASCHITRESGRGDGSLWMRARAAGVPTADGWHVKLNIRLVDNINGEVVADLVTDQTLPYTTELFDTGIPAPNVFTTGLGTGAPNSSATTDGTCLVDVEAGSGQVLKCAFWDSSIDFVHDAVPGPV